MVRPENKFKVITKSLFDKVGADKAIQNVLMGKIWNLGATPLTLLLVIWSLSPKEQGYYFTFASLQALQVFFELGLTGVIMQFASHEMAKLEWTNENVLAGDERNKHRLISLLRFTVSWYLKISTLVFITLLIGGFWFFSSSGDKASHSLWMIPWLLVCIGSTLQMFSLPFIGIAEGCGKISEIYAMHFKQSIVSSIVLWIGLLCGWGLYACGLQILSYVAVGCLLYKKVFGAAFRDLWSTNHKKEFSISWKNEIWPLQWKISLSWLCGYFIGQFVHPIIFKYSGAEAAGRYGLTLKIVDSIAQISYSWVTTKSAIFGNYISKQIFSELFILFRKSLFRSLAIYSSLAVVFMITLIAFQEHESFLSSMFHFDFSIFSTRMIEWKYALVITLNSGMFCLTLAVATLTRAEKKEPFLIPSIAIGLATLVSASTFGVWYGYQGIIIANVLISLLIGMPCVWLIYRNFQLRLIK